MDARDRMETNLHGVYAADDCAEAMLPKAGAKRKWRNSATGRRTGDPPRRPRARMEVRLRIPQLASRSGAPNFSIHDCG